MGEKAAEESKWVSEFPWDLEKSAREGFGAGCWSMDSGDVLWLERSEDGFEAILNRSGEPVMTARWAWSESPGAGKLQLVETGGAHAEHLDRSGLDAEGKSQRIIEVMGALALGRGREAQVEWEDLKRIRASQLGAPSLAGWLCKDPWEALVSARESLAKPARPRGASHG